MKVVVDTNVIVSALTNANGMPAKILSLLLNGSIKIAFDNRILFEYIEVLSRKEFAFNVEIINDLMNFLKHEGDFVNAEPLNLKFNDEADKKFYEVYKTGEAHYLITGNRKHFPDDDAILIPKNFIEVYNKKGPLPPPTL